MMVKQGSDRPKRGRPVSFDRAEVLCRAREVFGRYGYQAASIAGLSHAMRISPASIYAAFGSKEALYEEAVEEHHQAHCAVFTGELENEPDAIVAITTLLDRDAVFLADHPHDLIGYIADLLPGPVASERSIGNARQAREKSVKAVVVRLRRGITEGQVSAGADADAWGRFFGAIRQGMILEARNGASHATLMSMAEIGRVAFETLRRT